MERNIISQAKEPAKEQRRKPANKDRQQELQDIKDKMEDFYYREWHYAEKENNVKAAIMFKEEYRKLVMSRLIKKYYYNILLKYPVWRN